ncbi:MAG: hypothetical protein Q8O19_03420, partial [Rectinemataceae bacterium]|nr:hypothetical protein [Rectinemataceae bacterium]
LYFLYGFRYIIYIINNTEMYIMLEEYTMGKSNSADKVEIQRSILNMEKRPYLTPTVVHLGTIETETGSVPSSNTPVYFG